MTQRTALIGFGVSAALFGICCVVMLGLGHRLSTPAIVYAFLALWGLSAFAWPLFFIEAVKAAAASRRRRRQASDPRSGSRRSR